MTRYKFNILSLKTFNNNMPKVIEIKSTNNKIFIKFGYDIFYKNEVVMEYDSEQKRRIELKPFFYGRPNKVDFNIVKNVKKINFKFINKDCIFSLIHDWYFGMKNEIQTDLQNKERILFCNRFLLNLEEQWKSYV